MNPTQIRCTDAELELLTPIDDLPDAVRATLVEWLTAHGIDAKTLPVGTVVELDHVTGTLRWRANENGSQVLRWKYFPPSSWPTPFPKALRSDD